MHSCCALAQPNLPCKEPETSSVSPSVLLLHRSQPLGLCKAGQKQAQASPTQTHGIQNEKNYLARELSKTLPVTNTIWSCPSTENLCWDKWWKKDTLFNWGKLWREVLFFYSISVFSKYKAFVICLFPESWTRDFEEPKYRKVASFFQLRENYTKFFSKWVKWKYFCMKQVQQAISFFFRLSASVIVLCSLIGSINSRWNLWSFCG